MGGLKGTGTRLWRFVKEWNELFSIPIGLALFLFAPGVIRGFDGTAGAYDPSLLQAVVFGIAAFCMLKGSAWLLLRLDFPGLYQWLDDRLESETFHDDRGKLRIKLCVSLWLFCFYLSLLVVLTVAVL